MPGCVLATALCIYAKIITVSHILSEETFSTYYSKIKQVVKHCSSCRVGGKDVITLSPILNIKIRKYDQLLHSLQ